MASISEIKSKIVLNEMTIDTKVTDISSPYKSLEEFKKNLKIEIKHCSEEEVQFDLIGVDASLANAYRRIMIAEVPSMAIEKVYMMNNTSIMPDEVLAHRMGLIPILADAR